MIQAGSHALVFITVLLSFIILESSYQVNAGERSLVLQLTKANFTKVSKFKENVVLVIFFDSGHAHHKGLQSICEDVARVLEGVVPAAAVAIAHTDLLAWDFNKEYNFKKLPVLIFLIPGRPYVSYEGPMKAISIIEFTIQQVRSLLKERIRRKSVIKFHSFQSFDELVLKSKELWIIYFYYPRNKYMSLELMLWKMVVSDLKDKKLMLGFVECHSNTFCTDRFNIEASTVMAFGADKNRPIAYEGAKNASAIIWFSLKQVEATMPPLEVRELTQNVLLEECMASYICYVAFLPHISESNPYKYIKMILLAAEKHKWKNFCYVWTSLGTQPYLEKLFRATSFPMLIAINPRSRSYRTLRRVDNFYIESFIRDAELGEAIKPLKSALVVIDREAGDESSRVKAEEISGVHHLTPSNFTKVLNSKGVVLVGFFYPEDAHSRALKHTWEKASRLLLGVVPVAAVDCTTFKSLTEEYEVMNNFPTIKVFVHGKFSKDYQGDIDEIAIAKFAFQQIVKLMKDRLPVEKKTKKTAFVPCIITAVLVMAGITFALYRETRTRALNTLAVDLNGASKRKKPKKKP